MYLWIIQTCRSEFLETLTMYVSVMVRIYVSVFGVANFSWISLQVGKIFKKRGFREALQSSQNDARPFLSHTRTPFFWWTILFTTMVSTHYAHIIHIYPFHYRTFRTTFQQFHSHTYLPAFITEIHKKKTATCNV